MIYVLKKGDLYVHQATGHLRVNMRTMQRARVPNSKVKFAMTKDIGQAQLIEDPDMQAVAKYGLTAVIVNADKPKITETGTIYEC